MKKTILLNTMIMFLFYHSALFSQTTSVPKLINYQGMLTNAEGQALETKDYIISFKIFNNPTSGDLIWGPQVFDGSCSKTGHGSKIPVVRGHFNVILGPKDTNERDITDAFKSNNTYLEIKVGNNTPISPRQQILTTAYAFQSENSSYAENATKSKLADVALTAKSFKNNINVAINSEGSLTVNDVCPYIGFISGMGLQYENFETFSIRKGSIEIQKQIFSLDNDMTIKTSTIKNFNPNPNRLYSVYVFINGKSDNKIYIKDIQLLDDNKLVAFDSQLNGWYSVGSATRRCIGFLYFDSNKKIESFTQTHQKIMYHTPIKFGEKGLNRINAMPKITTVGYFTTGRQYGWQTIGYKDTLENDKKEYPFTTLWVRKNEAAVIAYFPFPCKDGSINISNLSLYFMGFDWSADSY